MAIELSIRATGSEKSYSHKQILYMQDGAPIGLSYQDDVLKQLHDDAVDEYKKLCPGEEPDDIVFRIKMVWK